MQSEAEALLSSRAALAAALSGDPRLLLRITRLVEAGAGAAAIAGAAPQGPAPEGMQDTPEPQGQAEAAAADAPAAAGPDAATEAAGDACPPVWDVEAAFVQAARDGLGGSVLGAEALALGDALDSLAIGGGGLGAEAPAIGGGLGAEALALGGGVLGAEALALGDALGQDALTIGGGLGPEALALGGGGLGAEALAVMRDLSMRAREVDQLAAALEEARGALAGAQQVRVRRLRLGVGARGV